MLVHIHISKTGWKRNFVYYGNYFFASLCDNTPLWEKSYEKRISSASKFNALEIEF